MVVVLCGWEGNRRLVGEYWQLLQRYLNSTHSGNLGPAWYSIFCSKKRYNMASASDGGGVCIDHVNLAYMVMCCRHRCTLIVEGAIGGRWSFPLEFSASEPEPDDVINIEAAGLNKLSTTSFYLSSYLEYDSMPPWTIKNHLLCSNRTYFVHFNSHLTFKFAKWRILTPKAIFWNSWKKTEGYWPTRVHLEDDHQNQVVVNYQRTTKIQQSYLFVDISTSDLRSVRTGFWRDWCLKGQSHGSWRNRLLDVIQIPHVKGKFWDRYMLLCQPIVTTQRWQTWERGSMDHGGQQQ